MMYKTFIGIDIGKNGAIAIEKEDGTRVVHDMPLLGDFEDIDAINEIISECEDPFVAIEMCQYIPPMGGKSAFRFGDSYGSIRTYLKCIGIPFLTIPPKVWKKTFNLNGKKKIDSVIKARELFPELIKVLVKSKDGRAEALLLMRHIQMALSH